MCLIHADLGVLLTLFSHRGEKFPPLWNEEPGLRANGCRVSRNARVVVRIFLFESLQNADIGEHVNPASLRVVKKVIRLTCNLNGRNFLSSLCIKDQQPRRHPAAHEKTVMCFVERHRKVILCCANGPAGEDSALCNVNDFNLFLLGNVNEETGTCFFKAKRFWMGINDDVREPFTLGVQKTQPSGALFPFSELLCAGVSDDHRLAAGIVANVVGVILHDTVKPAGDEQSVGGGFVKHPLWFGQIRNGVHTLAGFQVNYFNRVVLDSGHE